MYSEITLYCNYSTSCLSTDNGAHVIFIQCSDSDLDQLDILIRIVLKYWFVASVLNLYTLFVNFKSNTMFYSVKNFRCGCLHTNQINNNHEANSILNLVWKQPLSTGGSVNVSVKSSLGIITETNYVIKGKNKRQTLNVFKVYDLKTLKVQNIPSVPLAVQL